MIATAGTKRNAAVTVGSWIVFTAILLGVPRTANAYSLQLQPSDAQPSNAQPSSAQPSDSKVDTAPDSAQPARVQELRRALDVESRRPMYRWHDAEHPSPPSKLDVWLSKMGDAIDRAWEAFKRFVDKLWPRGLSFSPSTEKGNGWHLNHLRVWLALIAVLTLAVGGTLFYLRRRREQPQLSIPTSAAPLPDLSDAVLASQRSEDEWFTLAKQMEAQGEWRLALRAAYLGLLAGLAQREWLTIRRDRTNREYLDEFTRRWRRRPQAAANARTEVPEKLRGSLRLFDRVWYGFHELPPAAVSAYLQDQRELLAHV